VGLSWHTAQSGHVLQLPAWFSRRPDKLEKLM
jgi:hypothetical protein